MRRRIRLSFVHSDRVDAREFELVCRAAGFHGAQALNFGTAVYSGPSRSERRVAAAVGDRLWLPVTVEPGLSGSACDFDDELSDGGSFVSIQAPPYPAGSAALELALRHAGTNVALVTRHRAFERIAAELAALTPDHLVCAPGGHPAVGTIELMWLDSLDAVGLPGSGGIELAERALEGPICAFLRRRGADRIAHPGGLLLDHVRRTAQHLERWRARPALVAAGLCHAVYGTHGFPRALIQVEQRLELAQFVGSETEAIVYAYGACDRSAGYPSPARPSIQDRFTGQRVPLDRSLMSDLTELACANELDVLQHATGAPDAIAGDLAALFAPRRSLLSHGAQLDLDRALHAHGGRAS